MQFMDTLQYGAALRDWYAGYNGMMRAYFDPEGDLVGTTSPANPHAAHDLNAYTGRYGNPYFGEADITAENGQLVLTMGPRQDRLVMRSEEHTSELQSLMRISYAVFCFKKKRQITVVNT